MSQGWIKLHREIRNHWLYEENRTFSKLEAFMDLLLSANHRDKKTMIDGELQTIERGTFLTSLRTLCQRWNWSNTKTVKFLEILENDGMILKKSDTKKTLITIVNYEKFQGDDIEKTTEERQSDDTETTQKRTNKNVKNLKNEKKINKLVYADNVLLTEEEYNKLCDKYGKELTDESIQYLSLYKAEKNYATKSDNMTIQRWVINAVTERHAKRNNNVRSFPKANRGSSFKPEIPIAGESSQWKATKEEYTEILRKHGLVDDDLAVNH